jgi:type IV pilus assembly protein PilE
MQYFLDRKPYQLVKFLTGLYMGDGVSKIASGESTFIDPCGDYNAVVILNLLCHESPDAQFVLRNLRRGGPGRASGFGLIELLIVLTILGILAVLAIPSYSKYMVKARQADAKTQLTAIRQAQEIYKFQYGSYTSATSLLTGWRSTVGKYAFTVLNCSSTNFVAKASWMDGSTEMDSWTIDENGSLIHATNLYQIE